MKPIFLFLASLVSWKSNIKKSSATFLYKSAALLGLSCLPYKINFLDESPGGSSLENEKLIWKNPTIPRALNLNSMIWYDFAVEL